MMPDDNKVKVTIDGGTWAIGLWLLWMALCLTSIAEDLYKIANK